MTILEVLQKTEAKHHNIVPGKLTCDGIRCGNPEQECTGILLTCCPTVAMIQKARELGCNLIYAHETTFYHGYDETEWADGTDICERKRRLIEDNGIVIYRDHDQVHSEQPDMIYDGIIKKLGWQTYFLGGSYLPICGFEIPETTLEGLALDVLYKLRLNGARYVGDPDMKVRKVCLAAHFFGDDNDRKCIVEMEKKDYDVILPLETVDWTLMEYILDSNAAGKPKGVINIGHFNLEEAGMEMMQEWLREITGGTVSVYFEQSGGFFGWFDRKLGGEGE